jgi:hypothetical protein
MATWAPLSGKVGQGGLASVDAEGFFREGCGGFRRAVPRSKVTADRNEVFEDHVWFEDRWMVASWCDE